MEWGSESAAVRRHRVGVERRDGRVATPLWEREAAAAQEPWVDACGGGARTRKRSAAGSGGASRAAGTGLSEARAALGLALYLLVLRTVVQLSLQQLVLRGAGGHHGEFDARQARYWLLPPGPRIPVGHLPEPGSAPVCPRPCETAQARWLRSTWSGVAAFVSNLQDAGLASHGPQHG